MAQSLMEQEILQSAAVLATQADNTAISDMAAKLAAEPPALWLTVARGTSDHAAEYLSYWLMRYCGIPALSVPLSLNTIYQSPWQLEKAQLLAISQSGGSQDLLESVKNMRRAKDVRSLALVNVIDSPLAHACEHAIDIGAGKEKSVAATKSFIATLGAGLRLLSPLLKDKGLDVAIAALPEKIRQAEALDWSKALDSLQDISRLYVVGRGAGMSIAKEAALKFKETCLVQGEGFSGAEVQHGPMALMNKEQVALFLAPPDETQAGLLETAARFRQMGAKVLVAADDSVAERDLPLIDAGHPALQGLCSIQSFYRMVEKLSKARGINTDNPPNLKKVTSTQ